MYNEKIGTCRCVVANKQTIHERSNAAAIEGVYMLAIIASKDLIISKAMRAAANLRYRCEKGGKSSI